MDGFSNTKHPKRCSYIILESSPKDKWGIVAKAWENIMKNSGQKCVKANS